MLSRQELEELASHILKDSYYVSLFLDVDPTTNPKNEWLLHYKNLAKNTLSRIIIGEREQVKGDLDAIERFISDQPDGLKRGLCIISCKKNNIWKEYHTALPFNNQLVVDRDPYIKPIAAMLDLYQRYMIVDLASTNARIFIASMGEIQETTSISRPEPAGNKTRDGSSGDMGEVRARRQKEQSQRLLFKYLELQIDRLIRKEDIKRLLVAGPENIRGRFREALSPIMKSKIVGEFAITRNAGESELLKLALPLMKEAEHKLEREALEELFERVGAPEGSVLGLSDVLTALQQGNVRKLYVMSDMVVPGMACDRCGALTPVREGDCPYCTGPMSHVKYMLDLSIQKAMELGARIDMLEDSPELTKAGGIGALLRY